MVVNMVTIHITKSELLPTFQYDRHSPNFRIKPRSAIKTTEPKTATGSSLSMSTMQSRTMATTSTVPMAYSWVKWFPSDTEFASADRERPAPPM